jgi:hypothetical protein
LIQSSGTDGINKIVTTFLSTHEGVSKRQIEIKINDLAVKEKRPEDKYVVWHIRAECEKYLHMSPEEAAASIAASGGVTTSNGAGGAGGGDAEGASAGASASTSSSGKKRKAEGTTTPAASAAASSSSAGSGSAPASAGAGEEPKRFKRAFGFFVKAKRADAAAHLGDAGVRTVVDSLWLILNVFIP